VQQLLNLVQGINKQQLADITTLGDEGAFGLDNSGKLIFLNKQAERLLGWRTAEILNQNFFTRVNFTLDTIASIGASSCVALKSVGCSHLQKGAAITSKSGRILSILFISIPIFDQGRVIGKVFVFSENIDKSDPAGICEQVVNQCSGVLLKIDLQGTVVFANNYARQRFGDKLDNIIPADIRHVLKDNPQQLLIPSNVVNHCKDMLNDIHCIAWSINAIRENNGEVVGALCFGTELTATDARAGDLTAQQGVSQSVFQHMQEAVLSINMKGSVTYLNPVAERLTGYSDNDARGLLLQDVLTIVEQGSDQACMSSALRDCHTATSIKVSGILRRRDGRNFSVRANSNIINDTQGRRIGTLVLCHETNDINNEKPSLLYSDRNDSVTGLINRSAFEHQITQALHSAKNKGFQHALAVIDIDSFAENVDKHGEKFADDILKQTSALVKHHVSPEDVVARIGDDEFGVLLHNISLHAAQDMAADICKRIKRFNFIANNTSINLSVSIGLIPLTSASGGLADVLRIVDAACFVAKEMGRNRVHVYDTQELSQHDRQGELVWIHKIRQSLREDNFRLYTQKIMSIKEKADRVPHDEVLLRLLDDAGDLIRPGAFLPTAVRFGLMPSIDRWVIKHTLIILEQRFEKSEQVGIYAINLSAQSLDDDSFLRFVIDQLDQTTFPVDKICFEITESSAISNLMNATRFMSTVRGMGCRFSLDDFGRGFSSYAHLKNLPLDYLKIDGSFIRELSNEPINLAMVQSINQIAHILGVQTIAECVENEATFDKLASIEIDHVQGYYSGKPVPLKNNFSLVKNVEPVE